MNKRILFLTISLVVSITLNFFLFFWNPFKEELYKGVYPDVKIRHNKWWLEYIYQDFAVVDFKPDITEEYYEIIPLRKLKDWYYIKWDTLFDEELYQNYLNEIKEKIQDSIIVNVWNKKFIIHDKFSTELSEFEKNNNVKFILDNYNIIDLK